MPPFSIHAHSNIILHRVPFTKILSHFTEQKTHDDETLKIQANIDAVNENIAELNLNSENILKANVSYVINCFENIEILLHTNLRYNHTHFTLFDKGIY